MPDPAPLLVEVSGDAGLVLWQALRDVLAWVGMPEAEQAGLFGRGAALTRRASVGRVTLPPKLAVPVALLADLVADPAGTAPLLVMHACLRLARSLCARGAAGSALAYARAAALACPEHSRPLLEVGRLLGPARAEEAHVCLHRAAQCAAERDEPQACAEAHAELAALAFRRGDRRAARGHLVTAARADRRRERVR